jgi:hypothetical protein
MAHRDCIARLFAAALLGGAMGACARPTAPPAVPPAPEVRSEPPLASVVRAPCGECASRAHDEEVLHAVSVRIADLKTRGGACQRYGEVLEGSLAANRIVVRPFMWRVGPSLASAQARSTGEIDVARDIDVLNIGRRSLDDVVQSVEHEAAHIAFAIPSGTVWNEGLVDERVAECRAGMAR